MRRTLPVIATLLALGFGGSALAEGHEARMVHPDWSFAGPFGTFDQGQLQRGFKVYREVCSTCHTMNLVSFRNLGEKYGPFWDEKHPNPNDNPYVKSIAAEYDINDIDTDTGDAMKRKGTPADRIPSPFPNEFAARASNGGALPPDLSVMAKARHGGADYIYSLLTGFREPPAGLTMPTGMNYNMSMAGDLTTQWAGDKHHVPQGGFIAMKQPLTKDKVSFDDGTPSSIEQEARDVTAFLVWASEPKQTERKRLGMWVMIYLVILAGLAYGSYRTVWKNESH